MQKLGEILRKPELILYLGHIRGVIVFFNEAVIHAAGEDGLSLCAVEVVHLEKPVIHVARLIAQPAPNHVEKYEYLAFSGLFVHLVDLSEHLTPVESGYTRKQKFEFAHCLSP